MDNDAKLAILLSIFDTHSEEDLLSALEAAGGNVEQAIEVLLLKQDCAPQTTQTIRKKRTATISDYFGPSQSPRKKAAPLDKLSDADPKYKGVETTVGKPAKEDAPQTQLRDAFEVLRSASLAVDTNVKSLPPKMLSAENITSHIPCELFLNVLPSELATGLLEKLLLESKSWQVRRFVMFDKEVESPHTSSFYVEDNAREDEMPDMDYYYGGRKTTDIRSMFSEMLDARNLIEDRVNERMNERDAKAGGRHFAELQGRWAANIVVANCYRGAAEGVGPHTDRLTYIGPRPTIASLTLGATRPFRVRRIHSSDGSPPQTFNIMLPHNSLLIMFPPMQEEYRHEVPKTNPKLLTYHPISGDVRINLTYRVARSEYRNNIPICECGNYTELRVVIKKKESIGRYFYMCAGGGNEQKGISPGTNCGYFDWLDLGRMCRIAKDDFNRLQGAKNDIYISK